MLTAFRMRWISLRAALKREFLRDPDVILFDRGPDDIVRAREDRLGLR